jgi:surfeit locus 1 family protein
MLIKSAPCLVYLCLMPILVGLGIWQLNRAEEKRQILAEQAQKHSAGLLNLGASNQDKLEALLYQRAQVTGRYDNSHQFLLDNQIVNGKVGYYVLTPFLLEGGDKAILVNRGWLAMGKTRPDLPDLTVQQDNRAITGRIDHFYRPGIVLAGAEIPAAGWPSIIQTVDTEILAKRLNYSLFGYQLELDKELSDGFYREWRTVTSMPPEKHVAYAVQWFLLALTLTVLFFKSGFNRKQ